ncbi:anti-anti-sigma factor [Streptomyces sp. CB01635]|uniref:anti-sigma factor antagonist n=1 Tax=unclassified Streptomyces TaxID=2593676 RepID=UPI000C27FF57|nr:anti-sigma factor antagonist [Streptomyces sp. CB01635]PJN06220.1 anti-anti-sigma factor [Streptomyces sp. CB01635]
MRQGEQRRGATDAPPAPPVVYETGDCVVVALRGEVDIVTLQDSVALLETVAAGPAATVVIDLTRTTFFDCSGLTLLLRTRRRVESRGGRLRVVCNQPRTLRLLEVTGLLPLFAPAPTVEAAVRQD